jgi:hypothetical protein
MFLVPSIPRWIDTWRSTSHPAFRQSLDKCLVQTRSATRSLGNQDRDRLPIAPLLIR